MARHRSQPRVAQFACLLCGEIMSKRNLKHPEAHRLTCPIHRLPRVETERETAARLKREGQERF